jgi:hypothetical protein
VLSLPVARWPHDDGEVRSDEVTYRNKSAKQMTLDLALEAATRNGDRDPAAPLSVSPRTLTLPAGGRATVTVTADSSLGKIGTYGALLTARQRGVEAAQGVVLRTAVGFTKEAEKYTLTFKARDRGGPGIGFAEVASLGQTWTPSAAACSAATSSFFMPSIACIARWARSLSGSRNSSSMPCGTTCQETPYRSLSQPHCTSSPPSVSRCQ